MWELLVRELWHWERLYFSSQVGCGSAPVMNGAHLAPSIEVYDEGEELEHWLKVSTTETESVSLAFCTTAFILKWLVSTACSSESIINAQPLEKIKCVSQQPKVKGHPWGWGR